MTLIRPVGLVSRLLDSIGPRTLMVAVLSLSAFVAKASLELNSDEKRLDLHREVLAKKVDTAQYQLDQERLFRELDRISNLEDQILLMERRR